MAVAVVSKDTRDLLHACLTSLWPDAQAGRAEVWVVDNASEDGSAEMVRSEFPWVRLVASPENVGYGRAVNLVAERTAGRWIAASNSDIEVTPGAIEALLATGAADQRAGALAPRLALPDGTSQHSVHPFPTLRFTAAFNLGVHLLSPRVADRLCLEGHWDPTRARYVPWAIAAFLLVRREAFEAVDGFDEEQWMYAEDLDLGWRLDRAGWKTRYEPRATVRHVGAASTTKAFGEERTARWMGATYSWMVRRRGLGVAWAAAAVNLLGAAARAALGRPMPRDEAMAWVRIHSQGLRSRRALLRRR